MSSSRFQGLFALPVVVAALGFFVDVYDLLLFSIIRKQSVQALGCTPDEVLSQGEWLISIQMTGLLIGGVLWGIFGDRYGRVKVLFGSILLYSLANFANAFVTDTSQYAILRFVAGLGLAGELGAGVTLVIEILPKEKRGIAAAFVSGLGILGAVAAFMVSRLVDWRVCFAVGGMMGMLLLLLRVRIMESSLYHAVAGKSVSRGDFRMFFNDRKRFVRYFRLVLMGIPAWFIIGVMVSFSDKFAEAMHISGVDPGKGIMFTYLFISLGDMSVGLLSNWLKSRKKVIYIFYGITALFMVIFYSGWPSTPGDIYFLCCGLGFGSGFTVVYITMSGEQFGTNLRATAAVSIPNMIRGALPLIILLFHFLRDLAGDYLTGGMITGALLMSVAVSAALVTEETFGKDLDFVEE